MTRPLLLLSAALSGCAASVPTAVPALHPAAPEAEPAPVRASLAPLPAAPDPVLPAVLQPVAASMDGTGMDHSATDHTEMRPAEADAPPMAPASGTPLASAFDAYFALHDALASDRLDGVSAQAAAFRSAFAGTLETAPTSDPHFWHMRGDETAAVLAAATALVGTGDLETARAAFAALSLPFADLAEASGLPDGVARYTCGMRSDLPGDGVWLQREGAVRNPYFGGAMAMCGRPASGVEPASGMEPDAHEGHGDHGSR